MFIGTTRSRLPAIPIRDDTFRTDRFPDRLGIAEYILCTSGAKLGVMDSRASLIDSYLRWTKQIANQIRGEERIIAGPLGLVAERRVVAERQAAIEWYFRNLFERMYDDMQERWGTSLPRLNRIEVPQELITSIGDSFMSALVECRNTDGNSMAFTHYGMTLVSEFPLRTLVFMDLKNDAFLVQPLYSALGFLGEIEMLQQQCKEFCDITVEPPPVYPYILAYLMGKVVIPFAREKQKLPLPMQHQFDAEHQELRFFFGNGDAKTVIDVAPDMHGLLTHTIHEGRI